MRERVTRFCARLSLYRAFWLGLILGMWIELVTVTLRFGFGLQSTRDTGFLRPFTLGLRIHHGYVGVLFVLFAAMAWSRAGRNLLYIIGVGLIVSDLAHHFLVLWPITGSPQFDFVYPTPRVPPP